MLIIAIPKSASTALMITLGKIHKLGTEQDCSYTSNNAPQNCNVLHDYHSDVRELTPEIVERFTQPNFIYKQHVFPSPNNVRLLEGKKKVVLLRNIDEILLAYRRGAHKKVHHLLNGFSLDMNEKEWIEQATSVGLTQDLQSFAEKWKELSHSKNTLFVDYQQLLDAPNTVINQVETFFGLPLTQQEVTLVKARYSRRNRVDNTLHNSIPKIRKMAIQAADFLGIRNSVKRLLNRD